MGRRIRPTFTRARATSFAQWPKSERRGEAAVNDPALRNPPCRIQLNPNSKRFSIFKTFWNYEVPPGKTNVLMFRGNQFESTWNFIATGPLWLWSKHWFLRAPLYPSGSC